MKKINRKILLLLLLMVFILTSCRSVSISDNKTNNETSSSIFSEDDSKDLTTQEAIAEQKRFSQFTDGIFMELVSESSLTVHSYFSYPENYNLTNCPYTLGDLSLEQFNKDNQQLNGYLEEMDDYNYDLLTSSQKLTYDILKTDLTDSLKFKDYYLYSDCLSPLTGVPSSLPSSFSEFEFNDKEDVVDYIELIKLIPKYYDNIMEFETKKANDGFGIQDFQIDAVIDLCNEFISNVDNHFLITSFNSRINALTDLSDSEKSSYSKTNEDIVKNSIIPAYQKLISTLSTLKGKSVNDGGLCNFENGAEYYELLVRSYTGSDLSVSEIKDKLTAKMQNDIGTVVSLSYKDETLYDKMSVYPFDTTDPDTILKYLLEAIKADFPEGYDTNYTINNVPADIEKYESPAYFYVPHIDNTSRNNIYINKYEDYADMDLYPTLAHEGFPGHMYQTTYFQNTNPELLRSLLGYTGYTEGWGLYSELYSYDLSGQDSNLAKFNKSMSCLSYDTYCLADIGINYEGWSRQDTIDFVKSVGYDASVGDDVFETLIENPGLYLAYYIGYLEITDMRTTAQDELGDSFNIKNFHKFYLDIGPAQFEIINDRLNTWIATQKKLA